MTENKEGETLGLSDSLKTDSSTADKSFMETALKNLVVELKLLQDSAIQKHTDASEKLREYGAQLAKAMSIDGESKSFDDEWKAASDLEHISQVLLYFYVNCVLVLLIFHALLLEFCHDSPLLGPIEKIKNKFPF